MPRTILALIGHGQWGKNYLTTAQEIPECHIKYVCSRDYKKLLRYKEIDGIIIATPPSTHFDIASFFLLHAMPLLIEKPLTTGYQDALRLLRMHKESAPVVLVGHIFFYNPAFLRLKTLVPHIGTLVSIDSEGTNFGPMRSDVSALWDWAPHEISMGMSLMGASPSAVQGWSLRTKISGRETDDMVYMKLVFGKISMFSKIGWLSPIKTRRFTVTGTHGAIIFDDMHPVRKLKQLSGALRAVISYPSYEKTAPLENQLREFISCIRLKRKPRTDLAHGVECVRVIDAVERSIRQKGKYISL
ncbi:hypothetical protein A3A79_04925 [Candidatus Gottesmanbacteria bacterium RIFCSPLOWO2_01_FULL_43_11b]|uniref:Gfo/Idh/MocA-like oxidoreductase N-terminal domain-containing protein n=1 Tax=Candidatus Gottesmanbacteria bacterium RIFCSPLOWO2_01_FULL_43_11b TaxID=1798392 RepID=A0A1F6AIH3_9BACT|nr:MAG: hypothetical protein A3A79_04925 [Candidatus Gottesmanbacteria bacterium RIFCSPLOWO2_01_FULL_43_11b]